MNHPLHSLKNLTNEQSAFLNALEQDPEFTEYFFLTGGTLLKALDISPRYSNDLDFFTFPTVQLQQYEKIFSE